MEKSLVLEAEKESIISAIVAGLYDSQNINFYKSVLEKLIENDVKRNSIFFGLSKISNIENSDCDLFVDIFNKYKNIDLLEISLLSLIFSIVKSENAQYLDFCFQAMVSAVENEKNVYFILNNLGSMKTYSEQKTNVRQPELYNNIDLVTEFFATGKKPEEYFDRSSILLAILLEICTVFNSEDLFKRILSFIDDNLSLQIASIDSNQYDVEKLLFEKNLYDEYYVDCIERVKDGLELLKKNGNLNEFRKSVIKKTHTPISYETDLLGLSCIRYLAHSYFKNEILPEEWRQLIKNQQ